MEWSYLYLAVPPALALVLALLSRRAVMRSAAQVDAARKERDALAKGALATTMRRTDRMMHGRVPAPPEPARTRA